MVSLLDEVRDVSFGDRRLDRRLQKVISELGSQPERSIPAATHSRAEMEGAYRFFDNEKVSPGKILASHVSATLDRISECEYAVLVQDTTELDLTRPETEVEGAGPMDCAARRGAFHHPLIAFSETGLPLGTVWQKNWARETIEKKLAKDKKRAKRAKTPIEEKESVRWLEGIRAAREVAETCAEVTCVCVSDSESDIYEVFSEPRRTSAGELHLIVRACQSRCTEDGIDWFEKAREADVLFNKTLDISSRHAKIATKEKNKRQGSRKARIAEVEVRATTVTLRPASRFDRKLPSVTVNLVLAEEPNPPQGCHPIQWLLVTTLPIDTIEQVQQVLRFYCIRWGIEVYFRTLKTGCRVEDRLFQNLIRIQNCLAVYSIIAWRILYLSRLGRDCPDMNCEAVFEPCEWRSVYKTVKRTDPPEEPPQLNEMIRMIASLGGYVLRAKTPPGAQTLWIGLQRTHDMSTVWGLLQPDSKFF